MFQLKKKNEICRNAMKGLGESLQTSDEHMNLCEKFTCRLYGNDGSTIKKFRFTGFISRAGATQQMPPCLYWLTQHVQRANYMAEIWKNPKNPIINAPSPAEHGWMEEDNMYKHSTAQRQCGSAKHLKNSILLMQEV